MAPFLSNEQIEGLAEIQGALQLPFRYEDCIDFARVLNLPENQAKLATGEGIFKGFDPATDTAYLANYRKNIYEPGRRYPQEHGGSHYSERYTTAHFAPLEQLIGLTKTPDVEYAAKEQIPAVVDNELVTDNKLLMGVNNEAGMGRVYERKIRSSAAESVPSSSKSTLKQNAGGFTSMEQSTYTSSSQSTLDSGVSSTSASLQANTIKKEANANSSVSSTRKPYIPSYSSMNNAKRKKDNGNEFMRTKAKHFDDWLRRMKRAPLPQRPRGRDGKYTISRFKQKSVAIKALTSADNKSLIAFIKTKEMALDVVEQTGTADPSMYDDTGMLVIKPAPRSSKTCNQPIDSNKRGREEIGEVEGYKYSDEQCDDASPSKNNCTSGRRQRR